MGPADRLDIVEVNEAFVECIRRRLDSESPFQAVADRVRVIHGLVEQVAHDASYDRIVSGLPLNNFEVSTVEQILDTLTNILSHGGVLSFFQYIGIRKVKSVVSGARQRQRLRGVGSAIDHMRQRHEIGREAVWPNVPPAWVHHLQVRG